MKSCLGARYQLSREKYQARLTDERASAHHKSQLSDQNTADQTLPLMDASGEEKRRALDEEINQCEESTISRRLKHSLEPNKYQT